MSLEGCLFIILFHSTTCIPPYPTSGLRVGSNTPEQDKQYPWGPRGELDPQSPFLGSVLVEGA